MMVTLPQTIDTERLALRVPHEDCADRVAALMTPGVSRWLGSWPSPVSASDVRSRIQKARSGWEAGIEASWLVHRRGAAAVLGWIRVARESAAYDRGELGYWIGEAFQGRGYATEAARAALVAVFEGWKLSAVESGAQLENHVSFAVMQRLGMTSVGDRMVWASTRGRNELCRFCAVTRADFSARHSEYDQSGATLPNTAPPSGATR